MPASWRSASSGSPSRRPWPTDSCSTHSSSPPSSPRAWSRCRWPACRCATSCEPAGTTRTGPPRAERLQVPGSRSKRTALVPTVYIETYGCQMNVADTELILGHLGQHGWSRVERPEAADAILLNTCAIREHAEARVLGRLGD